MKRRHVIGISVFIFVLPFLMLAYAAFSSDEIGSKVGWSSLQGFEHHYRDKLIREGEYLVKTTQEGNHVLGALNSDHTRNVWILLNPRSEPFVKIMPQDTQLDLSPEIVSEITKDYKLHSDVREYLLKH